MNWRLVDSGIVSPEESCALDECILEARIKDLVPDTVHFYQRSEPTVSLGYFQKVNMVICPDYCKAKGIKIMRRASGGSAVYTDSRQLIYAVVLKEDLGDVQESYRKICEAIILGLNFMGIKAAFKPANDILIGSKKISGSAQLRRQGVILQHGTLIVDADFDAMFKSLKVPEEKFRSRGLKHPVQRMTSIRAERGAAVDFDELKDSLAKGFGEYFNVKIKKGNLTQFEKDFCRKLVDEKYANEKWNFKR